MGTSQYFSLLSTSTSTKHHMTRGISCMSPPGDSVNNWTHSAHVGTKTRSYVYRLCFVAAGIHRPAFPYQKAAISSQQLVTMKNIVGQIVAESVGNGNSESGLMKGLDATNFSYWSLLLWNTTCLLFCSSWHRRDPTVQWLTTRWILTGIRFGSRTFIWYRPRTFLISTTPLTSGNSEKGSSGPRSEAESKPPCNSQLKKEKSYPANPCMSSCFGA